MNLDGPYPCVRLILGGLSDYHCGQHFSSISMSFPFKTQGTTTRSYRTEIFFWLFWRAIEFSRNTRSQHKVQPQVLSDNIQRIKRKSLFPQIQMYHVQKNSIPRPSLMYIFIRILGKNKYFFLPWILSNAFELDANVSNYYGKNLISQVGTLPNESCRLDSTHPARLKLI